MYVINNNECKSSLVPTNYLQERWDLEKCEISSGYRKTKEILYLGKKMHKIEQTIKYARSFN